MDNIQKLVFGVISIAGLLAMLTPSDITVPQPETAAAAVPPVIEGAPAPAEGEEFLSEGENIDTETEDGDPFAIGEPSIDGNPIGQQSSQPQEAPQPIDMTQYGIPNYNVSAAPQYNVAAPSYESAPSAPVIQPAGQ